MITAISAEWLMVMSFGSGRNDPEIGERKSEDNDEEMKVAMV